MLGNFVRRILRRGELAYTTVLLAVLYLHRLREARRRWPHEGLQVAPGDASGCPEFLTAIMLADKYLYDTAFANQFWADANGRYTLAELNRYERRFLGYLEYDLYVSVNAFEDFIAYLERSLVLFHSACRGAETELTYGELATMSTPLPARYAADLPNTVPPRAALGVLIRALASSCAVYTSILVCLVAVAAVTGHLQRPALAGGRPPGTAATNGADAVAAAPPLAPAFVSRPAAAAVADDAPCSPTSAGSMHTPRPCVVAAVR